MLAACSAKPNGRVGFNNGDADDAEEPPPPPPPSPVLSDAHFVGLWVAPLVGLGLALFGLILRVRNAWRLCWMKCRRGGGPYRDDAWEEIEMTPVEPAAAN